MNLIILDDLIIALILCDWCKLTWLWLSLAWIGLRERVRAKSSSLLVPIHYTVYTRILSVQTSIFPVSLRYNSVRSPHALFYTVGHISKVILQLYWEKKPLITKRQNYMNLIFSSMFVHNNTVHFHEVSGLVGIKLVERLDQPTGNIITQQCMGLLWQLK